MTNEEKTSLKAACLQAATTLIAARDCGKGAVDVDECIKLAAELYCRLTAINWWPESTGDRVLRAGSNGPISTDQYRLNSNRRGGNQTG